jgi:glycerol-1-phosphate dehydrogenase [NAD(P)+]
MSDRNGKPATDTADIPHKLEDLLGFSASCGCGRTHSVEIRRASIRPGAVEEVVDFARDVGRELSVCVVADRITRELAGERISELLSSDNYRTQLCLLSDGAGERPHADEKRLGECLAALDGIDLAVAVGSGTVSDLVKLASYRKKIPYLAVATAPSMNGYTSAIAAIMLQGVKRTVDCHQPYGVLADLDILQTAPLELVAAGLGDLESKPTATADFRLAGRIRGEYYCPAPERVVMAAEARVASSAAGLPGRDRQALASLTEALLLSGISMKLAGSSSPASGGEHLISHFWDMSADEEGRVEGWHGAQVGVATLVTAALYEYLREIRPDEIDVEALLARYPSRGQMEKRIREHHGPRADEVISEFFAKYLPGEEQRLELERIRMGWDDLWEDLTEILRPAEEIRSTLVAGGAPVTVEQLGLTGEHLHKAVRAAREIRGRYTVLDFAASLGALESPDWR